MEPDNVRTNTLLQKVEEQIAQRHQQNTQQKQKQKPIVFGLGDQVDLCRLLYFKDLSRGQKFARHWSGPYIVTQHDWNKPWQVFISNPSNRQQWEKPIFINHLRLHGCSSINTPFTKACSPFAPPLDRTTIRRGPTRQWEERERQLNQNISDGILIKVNSAPTGHWEWDQEESENIKATYHEAYHNGFPTMAQTSEIQEQNAINAPRDMPMIEETPARIQSKDKENQLHT